MDLAFINFFNIFLNLWKINETSGFYIFWGLIILSLLLQVVRYGSIVTRVFALLLLTFSVVLMWVSQTAVLFVYLVYILAFISAVLMLFLSVVLMLPINRIL